MNSTRIGIMVVLFFLDMVEYLAHRDLSMQFIRQLCDYMTVNEKETCAIFLLYLLMHSTVHWTSHYLQVAYCLVGDVPTGN